jgi:hypothetical protein
MPGVIPIDLITGFLSFLFTLLILSYVVGDNPGFRLAIHAFVGVSAGYIVVVVLQQVIVDKLLLPLVTGEILIRLMSMFPLVLSLLLLGKMSSRIEWLGRPVVALLVGVGTAAAVTGAVLGTIFPQIRAAAQLFDLNSSPSLGAVAGNLLTGIFALVGTVVTLAYFQFNVSGKNTSPGKRGRFMGFFALLGQVFIAITLGAIFAGVLAAALTALVDRMQSLVLFVEQLLATFIP